MAMKSEKRIKTLEIELAKSKKTAQELQVKIDHLEDVIEELVDAVSERVELDKCERCGYYKRPSRDEIRICDSCDVCLCRDCRDDEPCCSGSEGDSSE